MAELKFKLAKSDNLFYGFFLNLSIIYCLVLFYTILTAIVNTVLSLNASAMTFCMADSVAISTLAVASSCITIVEFRRRARAIHINCKIITDAVEI